jgi:CBS domain containing-hemolysin-like protein
MSTTDASDQGGEPKAEPESTSAPEPSERAQESWLDRLKVAVGLKPSGTIREEIADALAADDVAGGFSPEERLMLANILRLREVRVADVMVPRADIEAVDIDTSLRDLFASFEKSGHSRMPVYRETLDDPVGFVHIKDLIGHIIGGTRPPQRNGQRRRAPAGEVDLQKVDLAKPLAESSLVRNILFVPPSMPVTALLAKMQASRMQLALVIDEYGGTDGLVSLEDIVEMVVGDIVDEHDDDNGPMIVPEGEGVFLADARADLDDVGKAVGTDFAPGEEGEDVDTLGGLVSSLLGRVPVRGELIAVPGGFEFEILDADPRRIKKLRIYRRPQPAAEPEPRQRQRPPAQSTSA